MYFPNFLCCLNNFWTFFIRSSRIRKRELEKGLEQGPPCKKPRRGDVSDKVYSNSSLQKRKRSSKEPGGSKAGGEGRESKKKLKMEEPVTSHSLPSTSQRKDPVPLTMNKFRYHHVLGEGSYGKVILGTDVIRKEQVAIKISSKSMPLRYLFTERHILELSNKCPFLIHGYGAFHTGSHVFYVMELARGGTLHNYIGKSIKNNIPVMKFLAAQIVCGLQFLHSKRIVHRDIKPGNILLTQNGHLKISDFGLALYNMFGDMMATEKCGTAGYMAPEILQCKPYNAGVDWFAFGVTLYVMLKKIRPFKRGDNKKTHRAVLEEEPSYKGLGPSSKDILKKLLCKEQSQRLVVIDDIRQHPFFLSITWEDLEAGRVTSPVKVAASDLSDHLDSDLSVPYNKILKKSRREIDRLHFRNFSFVSRDWAKDYTNAPSSSMAPRS